MKTTKFLDFLNSIDLKINGANNKIIFYEMLDHKKAFHLWPSSHFFASYILNFPQKFIDKSILELGSGIGFLGIVTNEK